MVDLARPGQDVQCGATSDGASQEQPHRIGHVELPAKGKSASVAVRDDTGTLIAKRRISDNPNGRQGMLKAGGIGLDGKSYQDSRSFTTVKPKSSTLPYLRTNVSQLLDDGTFGVARPIVVWFHEPIKDKVAAQWALTVTTIRPGWS